MSATRMLNRELSMSQYVEVDGGMLVKGIPILTVGTWTDSHVRTPLYYPAKTLAAYCSNWLANGYWTRHTGGQPRSILDLIGDVRNVRFDPAYKEAGMSEPGAILGDVFYDYSTQAGKDAAAKALARAKQGKPLAVSVEHGGKEEYNPETRRNEAVSLWFSGLASVEQGACEICNLPRANEGKAGGTGEREMNDEEFKQALADLKAEIMAEVKTLIEGEPTPSDPDPTGELEKKLSAALDKATKELESVKKENGALGERIKALEKRPNPSTVPEGKKELEVEATVSWDRSKGVLRAL